MLRAPSTRNLQPGDDDSDPSALKRTTPQTVVMRKVLGPCSIQRNFRDGVLAPKRLTAGFEVDVLGEALEVSFAALGEPCFERHGLDGGGLDARSLEAGKADDAGYTNDWHSDHCEERQVVPRVDQPPRQFATPKAFVERPGVDGAAP